MRSLKMALQRNVLKRCTPSLNTSCVTLEALPRKAPGLKALLKRSLATVPAARMEGAGGNVFAYFSQRAMEVKAVNLGQGFPTFGSPSFLEEAAIEAIKAGHNQYTRPGGHPQFVQQLADFYSPIFGREIDAMKEIVTFGGAQEGIFAILSALVNPGEEVLILEPYFDAYKKASLMLGIKTVGVPLRWQPGPEDNVKIEGKAFPKASAWKVDLDELESKITKKTRVLVLNTPHNPTGKVFAKEELEAIAEVLHRHPQVLVIADEVYEFMCYGSASHQRLATFPGLQDRVISLFSAGKTFSCTGWRIGYAICPPQYAQHILSATSIIMFCSATPLELACGTAFSKAKGEGYFEWLPKIMTAKRDKLVLSLEAAGMQPVVPEGGYFIMADTSALPVPGKTPKDKLSPTMALEERPDFQVASWLVNSMGVAGIPITCFYSPEYRHLGDDFTRFAFCKDEETLDGAGKKFREHSTL